MVTIDVVSLYARGLDPRLEVINISDIQLGNQTDKQLDNQSGNSNPLTAKLFNLNFTHLKLCLADAIHNFKGVKIIQI